MAIPKRNTVFTAEPEQLERIREVVESGRYRFQHGAHPRSGRREARARAPGASADILRLTIQG
ncbi:MAG: hypothetical protein ACREKH_02300, partial [Candidatus Rokuibacteriota bacterium]